MFASGDVHVLAKSGVDDSLEDLESSQDLDGVGGQGETITPTDVMGESRGKEGESPQLCVFEGAHLVMGTTGLLLLIELPHVREPGGENISTASMHTLCIQH